MSLTLFNQRWFNYICNVKKITDKITNNFLCQWYIIFTKGYTDRIKQVNF
jgi:hypothetical protein